MVEWLPFTRIYQRARERLGRMPSYRDKAIALIPAWNEGRMVQGVVRKAASCLPVVLVDDGSEDETPELAEQEGALVLRHEVNKGKGAALRTGFKWALERGVRAVVTLDADGQHNPLEIPKFIVVHRATGAELVIGRRDFGKMPFPRGYTNPFGSWLLSLAVGEPIHDNQSGFRLYDRALLQALDLHSVGFEFEVEVIGTALKNDLEIEWVDISTIYNTETRSYFHPVRDSVRFLRIVWQARNWRRPSPGEGTGS